MAGDAIEPTLRGGCSVIANREQRERCHGNVFVIRVGEDELVVRRAREKAEAEAGWLIPNDAACASSRMRGARTHEFGPYRD